MFYKNKSLLKTTLTLMVNNSDSIVLMNAIYNCFNNVNTKDVLDVETKNLCDIVKRISEDIQTKGLRTPEMTRDYIEASSLPDDVKRVVLGLKQRYSDSVVNDYRAMYSKFTHLPELQKNVEELEAAFDKLTKAGIDTVSKDMQDLIQVSNKYSDIIKEATKDVVDHNIFMIDVSDKDKVTNIGMDTVEQNMRTTEANRIKTGMWLDNITDGGFINQSLYLIAAIGGGFKSWFMQNITEYISMNMKKEDFKYIPDGLTPCIYYLNLEMRPLQMLERRLKFYGVDMDNVSADMDNDDQRRKTLVDEVAKVLIENDSSLPVISEEGDEGYSVHTIRLKLQEAERNGYKPVILIVDYLDLIKYEGKSMDVDQFEMRTPIYSKAYALRALSKEFNIPIITAAQLNRDAENTFNQYSNRVSSEDIVLRVSSGQIAKAYSLKAIPEQIYVCYSFKIEDRDYLSVVVDKDRQGKAKYVPSKYDKGKESNEKTYRKNKNNNMKRVLYVSKLENGVRLSKDMYSNTIKNFEDSDDSVIESMSVDDIDL